jgi:hypothetical protein
MEGHAMQPHSCDLCKGFVLDLSACDVIHHVEELSHGPLGETKHSLTLLDVEKRATAGCAFMTLLMRNNVSTVKSEGNLATTFYHWGKSFEMRVLRPPRIEGNGVCLGNFEVYAAAQHISMNNNPASSYLLRSPNLTPATAEGFQQARHWIHECAESHDACHRWEMDHKEFMPTRVLWVRSVSEGKVTIVKWSEYKEAQPYVALSYCWGGEQACNSLTSNLSSPEKSTKDLPLTIQDAIRTTREMGIHYLWVDRLVSPSLQSLVP